MTRFYDQTGDGEYNDWADMRDAFERAQAEIKRLREALQTILDIDPECGIARAALETK